jgi:benzoyl-CoA reductase/2-hydroxyglutaryl-CoA dehydratase subunit BcrC/BadD/HgdB
MESNLKKIGFTTSIPVEVLFAAGHIPVDINNIFINSKDPEKYIEEAESVGFPRNTCSWIKGIYTTVCKENAVDEVIGVIEGDCSNTKAMLEVMNTDGIQTIDFAYPIDRSYEGLDNEINRLKKHFSVNDDGIAKSKEYLDSIRKKLIVLDELTWKDNKATGFENHFWLVSASDFFSAPERFKNELDTAIKEIKKRDSDEKGVRLGYIGVPPVFTDLYENLDKLGSSVVFNEVQRQFSLPHSIEYNNLVDVYLDYTYPYGIQDRLKDIKAEINKRGIDGIIHYTQSFCFRGIEDIVIRKELDVPVLTLEGDRPGRIDSRTKLRLEAFIDMIRGNKK